jgi:hypothetical protein
MAFLKFVPTSSFLSILLMEASSVFSSKTMANSPNATMDTEIMKNTVTPLNQLKLLMCPTVEPSPIKVHKQLLQLRHTFRVVHFGQTLGQMLVVILNKVLKLAEFDLELRRREQKVAQVHYGWPIIGYLEVEQDSVLQLVRRIIDEHHVVAPHVAVIEHVESVRVRFGGSDHRINDLERVIPLIRK